MSHDINIEHAVRRAMNRHGLIAGHHNLDDLLRALNKDKEAGRAPKAAERAILAIQKAVWSRETMNMSQLIDAGMRNLFDVEV